MSGPGPERFSAWVQQAARAPSAHNTQPARWRLRESSLELHEDPTRWLRAGDASARDQRVALGMAWEAMSLAAGGDGWRVDAPQFDPVAWPAPTHAIRRIAQAQLEPGSAADPLAQWQHRRHCWRGKFLAATPDVRVAVAAQVRAHAQVAQIVPDTALAALACTYDRAAARLLAHAPTAHELYVWMRFLPHDARGDGLSAECMALRPFEARAASWLMRPAVLALVRRLGLLGLLVAERAKTLSASCLVLIHGEATDSPFDVGRRWYRFWLALTAAGFAAVPMSALVDEPDACATLRGLAGLALSRVPYNVMRVGVAPSAAAVSARLRVEELIVPPKGA